MKTLVTSIVTLSILGLFVGESRADHRHVNGTAIRLVHQMSEDAETICDLSQHAFRMVPGARRLENLAEEIHPSTEDVHALLETQGNTLRLKREMRELHANVDRLDEQLDDLKRFCAMPSRHTHTNQINFAFGRVRFVDNHATSNQIQLRRLQASVDRMHRTLTDLEEELDRTCFRTFNPAPPRPVPPRAVPATPGHGPHGAPPVPNQHHVNNGYNQSNSLFLAFGNGQFVLRLP